MAHIFYFHFFLMTQKGLANLSEDPQRSVKINIWQFLFQLIIVGRLGQERLIKFLLLGFS